jgi:hypothetical protein
MSPKLRRLAQRVRHLSAGTIGGEASPDQAVIADELDELAHAGEVGWALVGQSETFRMRVPGGWLYRYDRSIQFVPDAAPTDGCHLYIGDRVVAKIMDDRGASSFEELRVMRATESGMHLETADGHELTLAIKRHGP